MTAPTYDRSKNRPESKRGFAGLSQKLGEEIWRNQILLHDDGLLGYGGTRTFGVSGQGGGKTTVLTKVAKSSYVIHGINKQDYMQKFKDAANDTERAELFKKHISPETVLWRGREFDVWNVLIPSIFKTCYPDEYCKPLRVHVHEDSELEFYQQNVETFELIRIEDIDITRYSNIDELYINLIQGGNNIIYPPAQHYMSESLKNSLNVKRSLSISDRKYLQKDAKYLISKDIFLFEILEYLYRKSVDTQNRQWFTVIIDESHDLFRSNSPDIYWHIIDYMVDILVDTRKNNISLMCMTHALNLVDYRILERASHFIWLRGAKPTSSYSSVDIRLVKKLLTGEGVNESVMDGKIGGFAFDRIPNNLSRLLVMGLGEVSTSSEEEPDSASTPIIRKAGRPRKNPVVGTIDI